MDVQIYRGQGTVSLYITGVILRNMDNGNSNQDKSGTGA